MVWAVTGVRKKRWLSRMTKARYWIFMYFPNFYSYLVSKDWADSEGAFLKRWKNSTGVNFYKFSCKKWRIVGLSCGMSDAKIRFCFVSGYMSASIDLTIYCSSLLVSTALKNILRI
jgi:hypothetical protein